MVLQEQDAWSEPLCCLRISVMKSDANHQPTSAVLTPASSPPRPTAAAWHTDRYKARRQNVNDVWIQSNSSSVTNTRVYFLCVCHMMITDVSSVLCWGFGTICMKKSFLNTKWCSELLICWFLEFCRTSLMSLSRSHTCPAGLFYKPNNNQTFTLTTYSAVTIATLLMCVLS